MISETVGDSWKEQEINAADTHNSPQRYVAFMLSLPVWDTISNRELSSLYTHMACAVIFALRISLSHAFIHKNTKKT